MNFFQLPVASTDQLIPIDDFPPSTTEEVSYYSEEDSYEISGDTSCNSSYNDDDC